MATGLLLVDIQNDYFPGGNMELFAMDAAVVQAARLLEAFRGEGKPVYYVQHLSLRPDATFFVPETAGAEIHEIVRPADDEVLIKKNFPNAFRGTGLADRLDRDGVNHLVICGAMSHMCIDATTRAAFDSGLRCTVAEDSCATRDLEFGGVTISATNVHLAFMAALSSPYAQICKVADLLATDL